MDYEKAYKEALERARAGNPMDEVFPELKENEDERIRKALIKQFSAISMETWAGIPKIDIISWLEKQKENIEKEYVFRPLAGTDINSAALQAIRRADEGDRLVLAFNGAYIPVRKGCNANKIVDIYDAFIEKQKEQKPTNSEKPKFKVGDKVISTLSNIPYYITEVHNENYVTDTGCIIMFDAQDNFELVEQKPAEWDELQAEFKNINEAFEDGKKEVVAHPEKYGLCKPAEWSEEDEWKRNELLKYLKEKGDYRSTWYSWLKSLLERFNLPPKQEWSEEDEGMLNCIIATLCEESHGGRETNDKMVTWLENRLKSLRPRPHWKPSEEQMKEYSYWYRNFIKSGLASPTSKAVTVLGELLEQLKLL